MARATPKQILELGARIEREDFTEEQVRAIIEGRFKITPPPEPRQRWISPETKLSDEEFPITVDYRMSLEGMFAAGKYHHDSTSLVRKRGLFRRPRPLFPIKGVGVVNLVGHLLLTSIDGPHENILQEHKRFGVRPATAAELLAFGVAHPSVQLRKGISGIVAAGQLSGHLQSGWSDPCLHALELCGSYSQVRLARLFWWNHVCGPDYWFLAFSIETP